MFTLNPRVSGISPALVKEVAEVCPSTLGHMTDFGFIKSLTSILPGKRFAGNAVTVRIPHMDSCAVHKVFDIVQPGDVVCIDMSGDINRACWGELVSYMARASNIAGAIIDGCVTDLRALREIGVPLYARDVSPLTTRILGIEGAINVPVSICSVTVNPGDLILADDDGVMVIPPDQVSGWAERALKAQHAEISIKQRIDNGESLATISGATRFFEPESR